MILENSIKKKIDRLIIIYHQQENKEIETFLIQLKNDIIPSEQLLNVSLLGDFIRFAEVKHQIFDEIKENIKKVEYHLQSIKSKNEKYYSSLVDCIENYINNHNNYIKQFTEIIYNNNLYFNNLSINNKNLFVYENEVMDKSHNSIKDLYVSKSNDLNTRAIFKIKSGTSFIENGNIFVKNDNQFIIDPLKEYSIYQFYNILFPIDSNKNLPSYLTSNDNFKLTTYITPSNVEFKTLNCKINDQNKEIYSLQQKKLFIKGKTLQNIFYFAKNEKSIMEECQNINISSYSAHFISSLLLIPHDSNGSNFIIEENTGKLIGVDNDKILKNKELIWGNNKYSIESKNILYTIQPLLEKPISEEIKEQFIKVNPDVFIYEWLLSIEEKQKQYNQQIEKHPKEISFDFYGKDIMMNLKTLHRLPFKINQGAIETMLERFNLIRSLLIKNKTITHKQLFKLVCPVLSVYYELISYEIPLSINDQINKVYETNTISNKDPFNYLFDKHSKNYSKLFIENINSKLKEIGSIEEKEIPKIPIDELIIELIKSSKFQDFKYYNGVYDIQKNENHHHQHQNKDEKEIEYEKSLLKWLNLIQNNENHFNLFFSLSSSTSPLSSQSWSNIDNKIEILIKILKNKLPESFIKSFINNTDIQPTCINHNYIEEIIQSMELNYFNNLISIDDGLLKNPIEMLNLKKFKLFQKLNQFNFFGKILEKSILTSYYDNLELKEQAAFNENY